MSSGQEKSEISLWRKQMTKEERMAKARARAEELLAYDETLREAGYECIIGVDEVGRGPLAGPVVAAAVVLPPGCMIIGADDSKKVTEKRRKELYPEIMEKAVAFGFGTVGCERIDEVNILNATKEAMTAAVSEVMESLEAQGEKADIILVDAVELEDTGIPQRGIIKGDSTSLSISAASILAKVRRDAMMVEMESEWPGYGFAANKGYGTREHYRGLDRLGPCPQHRMTFLKKYFEDDR